MPAMLRTIEPGEVKQGIPAQKLIEKLQAQLGAQMVKISALELEIERLNALIAEKAE